MDIGRRVIYDSADGQVVAEFPEVSGDVLQRRELGALLVLDLPYGAYADEFSRVIRWHVDVESGEPVFDELSDKPISDAEYIDQLEEALLVQEGVI